MKVMKPNGLINLIKNNYPEFLLYIPKLTKLSDKHPDILVALSVGGGDCEADGVIAPITEEGDIDEKNKRPIKEGDPMPPEPFVWVPDR